jgi:DNA-binding NarL/FixJ family response regulator
MIRVLIADDQDFIRRRLRALLAVEPDIEICGEAHNGDTAVKLVPILLPDVVIMDISMPVLDGLQAARIIHEFFPAVLVVTVSQYELGELGEALLSGAHAHVPKIAVCERLVPTLRELPLEKTVN